MGSGTLAISVRFCAGGPVRNIHRAQGVCLMEPPTSAVRVPETPPGANFPLDATHSGGVLVGEPNRLTEVAGGGD